MIRFPHLVLIGAVCSGPALAQGAKAPQAPTQDKAAETFNEIERGFYLGGSAGPFFIVNPPATAGTPRPFAPGQAGAIEVGFDLGSLLSVGVFLQGTANHAGKDYTGLGGSSFSGDFAALIPGAAVRVSLLGLPDAQGTARTFLTLRAGAGYALFSPKQLLPDPDILAFAGVGVEYYTRLRHFSIGLELAGNFLVSSRAFGFSAMPNMRYAF